MVSVEKVWGPWGSIPCSPCLLVGLVIKELLLYSPLSEDLLGYIPWHVWKDHLGYNLWYLCHSPAHVWGHFFQ